MTTSRAFTVACAAALPLLVGLAALVVGTDLAVRSAMAGALLLVHLQISEARHARFLDHAAHGGSALGVAPWVVLRLLTVAVAASLLSLLGADAAVVAALALPAAAFVLALTHRWRMIDVSATLLETTG